MKKPKKEKMVLVAPELRNFEKRRRKRETRNEILITAIIGGGLTLGFIFAVSEIVWEKMKGGHIHSWSMLPFLVGIIASIGVILYLRRNPPYLSRRKYILTSFGVLMNFFSMLLLRGNVPNASLSFVPIASYVLIIVLSGLRYDLVVVVIAGILSLVLQFLFLFYFIPIDSYTIPSAISTFIILGGATVCTTYVVSSILSLHIESIWKDRLAQFLAPEVVKEISQNPELLRRTPTKRTASVLFVDIRNFTSLCENLSPERIGEILNIFLEEMTMSIMKHRGMVDKYIGDSIMGVFGIPVESGDHAIQATRAAIDMQNRLKGVNSRLAEQDQPPLSIGIGIHSGEVVAGAVGSSRKLEYTVIGDTVNVASRIESLTKEHSVIILISEQTRKELDDTIPLRKITTAALRGRKVPVELWSPIMDENG